MSGNCDEERSGNAGVHTNPAQYQHETSTSIHERNTAGNHGGYSSSNSEQSTVGQIYHVVQIIHLILMFGLYLIVQVDNI